MKMKQEHYDYLEKKINAVIENDPFMYNAYMDEGLSHMRYNWDLLWEADLTDFTTNDLYKYLNDTHIDTALRKITGRN